MPIFEKDGRRVYFAHIPKSGGSSIYSAFVGSGWTVKNLSTWRDPRSVFSNLQKRFGVETIPQEGRTFGYPHPPQHAPSLIWRTWGPFETSFAVTRSPMPRLLSALRYHHRITEDTRSFQEYAEAMRVQALSRPWAHLFLLSGHLIPQHHFVTKQTEIFSFEEDWGKQIAERFDVSLPPHDNRAPAGNATLPESWSAAARRLYRRDFVRFGY